MNKQLAQKLLERVKGTIKYNLNIIDEKGMIIASSDKSREGSFHEAAYNMIQQGVDLVEINEDQAFHGTKKGVNMTITSQGKLIGVVGITGDPDEVRPLATLMKISVEVI
ncbi:MAG: CdaR family transcriptional regulator, partial [Clostridia bacterium]|nr:CdaR family transcriptional regulator [Clostridia bacterium]